jgi:hypothetical protein
MFLGLNSLLILNGFAAVFDAPKVLLIVFSMFAIFLFFDLSLLSESPVILFIPT